MITIESEAITKTLNLSHATVRQIFALNTQVLLRNRVRQNIATQAIADADRSKCLHITSLREAVLRLPRLEQQELAALAWLGSQVFEDFDVALRYARILKERELIEFLEIIPTFDDLDRGIRLLDDSAIHLS